MLLRLEKFEMNLPNLDFIKDICWHVGIAVKYNMNKKYILYINRETKVHLVRDENPVGHAVLKKNMFLSVLTS